MFNIVDLPEPDGPIMAMYSPSQMERSTPRSTFTPTSPSLKVFSRFSIRIMGVGAIVYFVLLTVGFSVLLDAPALTGPRRSVFTDATGGDDGGAATGGEEAAAMLAGTAGRGAELVTVTGVLG